MKLALEEEITFQKLSENYLLKSLISRNNYLLVKGERELRGYGIAPGFREEFFWNVLAYFIG
ncbi:MAG: hypothetical protein ACHQUC_04570 [Chlamydiales bacterium]